MCTVDNASWVNKVDGAVARVIGSNPNVELTHRKSVGYAMTDLTKDRTVWGRSMDANVDALNAKGVILKATDQMESAKVTP